MAKASKKTKNFIKEDDQDESQIKRTGLGDIEAFIFLLKFARPWSKWFALGIVLLQVSSVLAISSGAFLGMLVEDGLLEKNYSLAIKFALLIVLIEVGSLGVIWLGRFVLGKYSSLAVLNIRSHLFEKLDNLPLSYFDRQPQGRVVTRLTHDVEGVENFFTSGMGRIIQSSFMGIGALLAMVLTAPKVGMILVVLTIPSIVLVLLFRNPYRQINRKMSKDSGQINSKLSEHLNGIDVIRSFGLEDWAKEEYDFTVNKHLDSQLKANLLFGWSRPLITLLMYAPLVGLVWWGGGAIFKGTLTIGSFVALMRYCERFLQPIITLAREIHVIQAAFTSGERVASFLKEDDEEAILGPDGHLDELNTGSQKITQEIRFNNVWMAYKEEDWVLKGVSFNVAPGEKIGLVGPTGCGKTTIISLLSRLYPFQKGKITFGGENILNFKRSFLRNNIGLVSQDVAIFKGSLRENLYPEAYKLDREEYVKVDEKILEAAKVTGLSKIMKKLEIDFDFQLLEGGQNLSAGERQLLSFTRILIKDPAILILDEATSNIDPEFEKMIQSSLEKLTLGRTCFVVAHRLETMEICQKVLVFDHGVKVEEGPITFLLAQKGAFHQFYHAQNNGILGT